MALSVGDRLGHYDVTALIGEGGMGQVYQATDTKLKRQVALKILPEAFAADPERLARFQREAEILASLNHPNIAAIYGLEESGDIRVLVLELVEGQRWRIASNRGRFRSTRRCLLPSRSPKPPKLPAGQLHQVFAHHHQDDRDGTHMPHHSSTRRYFRMT